LRKNLIISASGHAAVLVVGLITFASSTPNVNMSDFMPVEIATPDNISNATAGVKNAPKPLENPKPLADKIGEPKPAKELAPKVVDKPEIRTDAAAAAEQKLEDAVRRLEAELAEARQQLAEARRQSYRAESRQRRASQTLDRLRQP